MKCPKCHSEVGSQSVCPYCGATLYISGSKWSYESYPVRPPAPVPNPSPTSANRRLERLIDRLDAKIKLVIVLQCGTFALLVLVLLAMALQ